MIGFGNDFMEKMIQNKAKCKKCHKAFSFEQGGKHSRELGIKDQVCTCPHCNTVYEINLTPDSFTLLADVSERYANLIKVPAK